MKAKKKHTNTKLLRLADKIQDNELRQKVMELLEDPTVIIGGIKFDGLPLETSPASKKRHHSYPKGLVQHTLTVATISISLSNIVEKIYRTPVNRDVVLASALLHDIMKPLTYTQEDENYGTSSLGERLDHLSLAVAELVRRGFPLEIVHTVAAHHGRGGPMSPRTIEALICSLADGTDATLNGETLDAAKYLIFDCVGEDSGKLSAEEAFHIVRAKQDKGCAGVVAEYEKIQSRRFKKA
ncbi:HDIG domain-containing protein [Candidatus Bathyarchaeota archaeon]|nr:HDIG domain-containing protein [Candidatus Bathyarchaeota archaeon]